jgi:hypothetical protein
MPIKFRCAYCNQLLGIARRKAGTVVRCPTCAGQVVVPTPEGEEAVPAGPKGGLFERSDFDNLFEPLEPAPLPQVAGAASKPAPTGQAAGNVPAAAGWRTEAGADVNVEPVCPPPEAPAPAPQPVVAPRPGIVLSPFTATVLSVLVILGLAVAFGAGLAVGWYIWSKGG